MCAPVCYVRSLPTPHPTGTAAEKLLMEWEDKCRIWWGELRESLYIQFVKYKERLEILYLSVLYVCALLLFQAADHCSTVRNILVQAKYIFFILSNDFEFVYAAEWYDLFPVNFCS